MTDAPALRLAELLRPELAELRAYAPEAGDFRVRLDANEAPPLLSDAARQRLAEVAAETAWERYPDAREVSLRQAIAERMDVSPDEVLTGTGSDEVISMLLTALSRPRGRASAASIVTTTPSFVMYRMSARVRGMNVIEVPLDAAWDIADASLGRALEVSTPNVVFIATPNNPTGTAASRDRLERVIQAADGALVVLDEAYVDYASDDLSDLYRKYENVALMRTLSKVGFAALRVGWLVARPALVHELDKARLPYNMPTLSQRLAVTVLRELSDEVERITQNVIAERERVEKALSSMPGVTPTPSQTNFIWLKTERPAGEVFEALVAQRVLTRSFHARGGRLAHQLRVTIGTAEENDIFLGALGEAL